MTKSREIFDVHPVATEIGRLETKPHHNRANFLRLDEVIECRPNWGYLYSEKFQSFSGAGFQRNASLA